MLKVFENNEFGQVRVIEQNGEPWFVAKDVCDVLEHTNNRVALNRLDADEKGVSKVYTLGGEQKMGIVNEYGLYNLILTSNLPKAKEFKRWVTHEVIPDIRKHGMYMTDNLLEVTLDNPDFMIDLLQNYKLEKQKRLEVERMNKMLVHAKKLYTSTEIAKELHFKSATEFNKRLRDMKIQYRVNNTWVLTSDYADNEYTSTKEQVLDNGHIIYDRKWTGLGSEFLLKLFNEE